MISFMGVSSLIITFLYALFMLVVLLVFLKPERKRNAVKSSGISVLIPYRNEEKNLDELWKSIVVQKNCNAEIIFINDASDDSSEKIVEKFSSPDFKIQKLSLPNGTSGKKSAIELGIENANFEKIITLDADCIPASENWISLHQQFNHQESKIVGGAVFIQPSSKIWSQIQELEVFATQVVSYAMAKLKHPVAISGANLSYEKSFFKAIDPYSDNKAVKSGDDIYFLQKAKKNKESVVFDLNPEMAVKTKASSWSEYFNQRLRWMKKGSSFADLVTVLTGILIFLAQATFLFGAVYQMINHELVPELLISMSLKIGIDFLLLFLIALKLKRAVLMLVFIPAFVFSILAFVFIITLGWLIPIQWKGRKI